MPMCKKCKEVFGAQELKAGYCEKCYTPELEAQDKKATQEKEEKKSRLTIKVIASIILVVSTLTLYLKSQSVDSSFFSKLLQIGLIAGSVGLFLMKKWGANLVMGLLLLDVLAFFGLVIYTGFILGDFGGTSIAILMLKDYFGSFGIVLFVMFFLRIVEIIFIRIIYKNLKLMQ